MFVSKNLTIALTAIVIILIATAGFLAFQNRQLSKNLAKELPSPVSSPESPSPTPPVSPSPTPSPELTIAQVQENIEASLNSGNTAALLSYMAKPKVNFSLMSTECCQPQTPDEAVAQMNYASEGTPFDFNQTSDIVKTLKSKNPQLAGTFIGISKNKEHLAAFTINSQNRIEGIQLSISWKLYNY